MTPVRGAKDVAVFAAVRECDLSPSFASLPFLPGLWLVLGPVCGTLPFLPEIGMARVREARDIAVFAAYRILFGIGHRHGRWW